MISVNGHGNQSRVMLWDWQRVFEATVIPKSGLKTPGVAIVSCRW